MRREKIKKKGIHVLFLFFIVLFVSIAYYFFSPDVSTLRNVNIQKTSFMQYREREWQREGKKIRIRQVWMPLSQISPFLIKAVLISEDDKFWRHDGFDFDAIENAMEKDIKEKKFRFGASTISQQLARNLYLSPSKNPLRKIQEAILTWRMEKILTKRRILELYLNVAEWGEGIFGIEAASRFYYDKSASALDPAEASRLASVLPNPRKYNPVGTSRFVLKRSRIIYNIIVRRGIVIPQYQEVMAVRSKGGNSETPSGQGVNQGPVNIVVSPATMSQ